jgi:hypothetical protein
MKYRVITKSGCGVEFLENGNKGFALTDPKNGDVFDSLPEAQLAVENAIKFTRTGLAFGFVRPEDETNE